ncbi:helix-turn-helix domain-containing protein [Streptomyces xantholiticus]|uniref:Helix-turn-helix domain-containing protein n=1 Tax=Streptomyces xantholiticus TaxID=68285 RepID=A0ABV1V028_9ACTN
MSLDPILWAMKDAPTADINEWGTLLCLAEKADEDGCNAFPSVKTIASYTGLSTRTVQRALAAMMERKLIAEGDQRAALYLPEHRRPTVYDLLIPYDWFRDIERTNVFRMRLGRRPLTLDDRPPIAPAPPKKTRADKGKPKPNKDAGDAPAGSSQEGRQEVAPVENPPSERGRLVVTPVENTENGVTTSQGVTSSRDRGDFKSEVGRLEVTQPTPSTRTTDSPRPSVGSIGEALANEEGRKDGQALDIATHKKQARAIERTPGVDLLLGLGYERPEMLLTGRVLADQARMVDGLLLGGWDRDHVLVALLRPLPPQTRSVGAVISRRLRDLAASPVPRPTQMPAPRNPEAGETVWEGSDAGKQGGTPAADSWSTDQDLDEFLLRKNPWAECRKCHDPIVTATGTDRCVKCEGWPQCPLCQKYVQPGTACEVCEVAPHEIEFEVCEEHGDRFIKGTACFQCLAPKPVCDTHGGESMRGAVCFQCVEARP